MNTESEVESPCVLICDLFENVCQGCGRSLEEIGAWSSMTNEQKQKVVEKSAERLRVI